jgi:hypothetical protein
VPSYVPNPLLEREPELVGRLASLRQNVYALVFKHLAADAVKDPAFYASDPAFLASNPAFHVDRPFDDVRALALTLRVLTKHTWEAPHLRLLDACWRTASRVDLFAEEFEGERHRIERAIEAARAALQPRRGNGPSLT